jgi:hypothetical protein
LDGWDLGIRNPDTVLLRPPKILKNNVIVRNRLRSPQKTSQISIEGIVPWQLTACA